VDVGSVGCLRDKKKNSKKIGRQIGAKPKMSKKMLKREEKQLSNIEISADRRANSINLSHSLCLVTLPYSYTGSGSCPWQLFNRVERRLKRE